MNVLGDLERVVAGRHWLIAVDTLAGAADLIQVLRRLGAADIFVLAGSRGVGDVPDIAEERLHVFNLHRPTMMESFRAWGALLADLPAELLARIDEWDPDRSALVLGGGQGAETEIAHRRIYGPRRAEWLALEDKLVATELWEASGVPQAPFMIVPAEAGSLREAHAAMAGPLGSVWVADNRRGWHGGAEYLRWVTDDPEPAIAFMQANADRVRVMPFLDGIPCSIHGFAGPDRVAVFRPVEMLIVRDLTVPALVYGSVATRWDPRDEDREYMRDVARRVGRHLMDTVGYRGGFGIDGVMTVDGFRPTELNARMSAGIGLQFSSWPDYPRGLFNQAFVENDLPTLHLAEFERLIVGHADTVRSTRIFMPTMTPPQGDRRIGVVKHGETLVTATDESQGVMRLGDGPPGAILRIDFSPGVVAPGPSLAPLAVAGAALANEQWDLGLGDFAAAPDVRPRLGGPTSDGPLR